MREEKSTFGAEPQHLDKLLSLGIEGFENEATIPAGPEMEAPGGWIGRYKLLHVLGEGGMGIVYLAEQTEPVKREVALKVIKPGMDSRRVLARFEAEQQALALLEHPHVARVYDAGLAPSGRSYFVMEYVKGIPITEHCDKYRLTIEERLCLFLHVCEAIQHAHQKGIIHRDLKPSNILVVIQDQEMIPKVIDFGVARAISQPLTERTLYTEQGQIIGTPEYMSPEQAEMTSQDIDTRSDIYSLGAVLYELLTGILPFESDTLRQGPDYLRKIIREQDPKTPSARLSNITQEDCTRIAQQRQIDVTALRRMLRGDLEWIVMKCLEKDRMRRYETTKDLAMDIERHLKNEPVTARPPSMLYRIRKLVRRKKAVFISVAAVIAAICAVGLLAVWFSHHQAKSHWAREEFLPKIERLIDGGWVNYLEAYKTAIEAKTYIPRDARLIEALSKVTVHISIKTEPSGAKIYMREYKTPETEWEYLGTSPIENIRLPIGFFRWKLEKQGYETVFAAIPTFELELTTRRYIIPNDIVRALDKKGTIPSGMVRIKGQGEIQDFFMDRHEVTNRQFKEFVDKGGYEKSDYWKHKFIKDGREITWENAMKDFVDTTGKSGPATWQGGDIPDGRENHPVSGISWYEAAAYADSLGKNLPTAQHWDVARSGMSGVLLWMGFNTLLAPMSNFDGEEPVPVGSYPGMTAYGAYDLAGNVREWCWNETPKGRIIRGGAWNDATYMFSSWSQASPFDRSDRNGLRCVFYLKPDLIPLSVFEAKEPGEVRDFYQETPVSDSIFQVYKQQFDYDKTELNPLVEWKNEESPHWTQEKITFNAAYENERITAYLFLPKRGTPPYQTVVYFPSSASFAQRSSQNLETYLEFKYFLAPLVENGRAVLYPVYKGTFERGNNELYAIHGGPKTHQYTEFFVKVVKDFRRCIDYLQQERSDIDGQKFAYWGFSTGGSYGTIITAVENRLVASVLAVGGMSGSGRPEVNPINYIGRVKVPTLMLNGKYDLNIPYETRVKPMFELLGTPAHKKELKLYETDHFIPRDELIKETLIWLDRHLGRIQ
ncbi:SUMF1/EgtB/PvdO family nonheme iron enzyme [Planctomycetota bacterium]